MKKLRIGIIVVILALLPLLTGCARNNDVEVLTDRFFVQQMISITQNVDQYVGRTIQLEGMFWAYEVYGAPDPFYFVIRYLSSCCGGGGSIGFEVYLGDVPPFPDDTWVAVSGVLEVRDGWQPNVPVLVVTSIEAMDERGQEIVYM